MKEKGVTTPYTSGFKEMMRTLFPYDPRIVEDIGHMLTMMRDRPAEGRIRIDTYDWDTADQRTLRATVVHSKAYNVPHGVHLCHVFLSRNIFHFEDFEEMALDWYNVDFYLTEHIMLKVQEVGAFIGKLPCARDLANHIANSGPMSWRAIKHTEYGD
jgi:hypothetical protein